MRTRFVLLLSVLAACVAPAPAVAAPPSDCALRSYTFGGGVVSLGPDSVTVEVDQTGVHDRRLDGRLVHVRVDAQTRISRDGQTILFSDLVLNEHVAVVAAGCRDLDRLQLTASLIHAGDRDVSFAGSVVSLGPNSLTVEVDRTGNRDPYLDGKRVAVAVDQNTKILRDRQPIELSQLVLQERVGVLAEAIAHRFTATLIRAGEREITVGGSISAVGSNSLTVEVDRSGGSDSAAASASLTVEVDRTGGNDGGLGGRTVTFAVDQNTKIVRDGQPISLSDLIVGEHVNVHAEAIGNQYTAALIRAGERQITVGGSITAVGTSSLTVEVDRTGGNDGGLGQMISFSVDQNTSITLDGQPAQLSQLAAGDRASVHAVGIGDQYTAEQVQARVPRPMPKPMLPAKAATTTQTTTTSATTTAGTAAGSAKP